VLVVAEQTNPVEQLVPQHGWLAPPHTAQVLSDLQTSPLPQSVPEQQACPLAAPQGAHLFVVVAQR
jgi:hypothetical protein